MKLRCKAAVVTAFSAVQLAVALTPEGMISNARRSELVPNSNGEWAVFSSSNYSFETHTTQTVWNLMNLTTGEYDLLYNGSTIAEMVWVGETPYNVLYVNATNEEDDGGVSIYSADVRSIDHATLVTSLPAPYSGLKAVRAASGNIHWLAAALSYPNGTAYNEALVEEPVSSARMYTSIYVRHWDRWLDENTYAVFGGVLTSNNGEYSFDGNLTNYVTGIQNVTRAESPIQPFGGSTDYDISPDGSQVVFITKSPDLPLANYTAAYVYHVPFNGTSEDAVAINGWYSPAALPNARGAVATPTFSHDGQYIAYLQMDGESYESDKNKIYISTTTYNNYEINVLAEEWDRSPDQVKWSTNDSSLIVNSQDAGRTRLFTLPANADDNYKPSNITDDGSVSSYTVLPNDDILVTASSIWSPTDYYLVPSDTTTSRILFQANRVDPALAGLGPEDVSEFYYQGNWTQVQAWIVYPENFDTSRTYPLAFLVHGGPQSAWLNSWSNRWNPKVWADQGYVVVTPNPTGSTGFGKEFVDAIQNNWGSYPYSDLELAWEHINANLSYVDTDNGIEGGASYGGYMTNWIQGHDLGRKFKALVTHDGSTNTNAQYASEELWFMQRDFNGTIWDARDNYDRYNPINHINNWATPHFVIHNTLDYRLPEAEGIFLFNVLQEKGIPSKFLNFPDENHWVLKRENSLVWHREIYRFINYFSGVDNSTGPY